MHALLGPVWEDTQHRMQSCAFELVQVFAAVVESAV